MPPAEQNDRFAKLGESESREHFILGVQDVEMPAHDNKVFLKSSGEQEQVQQLFRQMRTDIASITFCEEESRFEMLRLLDKMADIVDQNIHGVRDMPREYLIDEHHELVAIDGVKLATRTEMTDAEIDEIIGRRNAKFDQAS